jgi:hypothetical protein
MPLAYQRAQEEWPWIGNISYWFFKRADDSERGQAFYYFRMVEPDFTPLPVYEAMKNYIASQTPVLYPGVHQAESWEVQTSGEVKTNGMQPHFGKDLVASDAEFTIYGTDVGLRWHCSNFDYMVDGGEVNFLSDSGAGRGLNSLPGKIYSSDAWREGTIHLSLLPEYHVIKLQLAEGAFCLDSITVLDRTFENIFPLVAGAIIAVGMLLWAIISGVWARRK